MARNHCIPGVFFLTCATVLLILVSISLPGFSAMDITRVHFGIGGIQFAELRLGIWAYCVYDPHGTRKCQSGHPYALPFPIDVGASWTRGLAIHPVAAAASFISLLLGLSTHLTFTLIASVMSFFAAFLTLLAFAIDIALYTFTKHQINKLDLGGQTVTAPGFWVTFVALVFLLLGGCTVCFGHRHDRRGGNVESYPMSSGGLWNKFRR